MRTAAFLVCLSLVAGGWAPPPTSPPTTAPDQKLEKIVIAGRPFRLDVAADPRARARGLMDRKSIEPDRGMLFIYPDAGVRRFWMANCLVDMDLIFLDPRGTIVALHRMKVEPPQREDESRLAYEWRLPRYSSRRPAQFAIELRAGSIDRLELKRGMKIDLDLKRLRKRAR